MAYWLFWPIVQNKIIQSSWVKHVFMVRLGYPFVPSSPQYCKSYLEKVLLCLHDQFNDCTFST